MRKIFTIDDLFIALVAAVGYLLSLEIPKSFGCPIRERYGDGRDGFVFDDQLKQSELDEFNRQNRQIHGAFDKALAVKTMSAYPTPSRP